MATKAQIKSAIADNIKGQFNQVDISGKLGDILDNIVDLIPSTLAEVTLESSAASFTDASDLAKAAAATALGITAAQLDDLMAGKYTRFAYGTNHAKILAVDSADGASLSMGAGYLKVTYATEKYAIDVA